MVNLVYVMSKEGRDEKGKFTAGNLFSMHNNGGKPPKYDTPEQVEEMITQYLDWEDAQKGKDNKGIYTLTGCALFLGFATRQSMYDYEKLSPEFSYVINKFRSFMTHWNEQKLYWGGTYMGSQFWLRNHGGYSDESTQHLKQTITEVKPEVVAGTPKIETE
jgi:hypothetical protein